MIQDLKASLEDLAQAEYADAPASTVDIDKARADGRRRMLASRVAPLGGGVAVVAACALVVNGLGGTSAAKPVAPATSAAAGHEFAGTDPLTKVADFGYLPDGFQVAGWSNGSVYGNSVTARTKPMVSWGTGLQPVNLRLTHADGEMHLQKYMTKKEVTVSGSQKAYLVTNPGDPGVPDDLSLEWQTASGSWYYLGGDYQIHGNELEAMLVKVAESVTADDTEQALPLHIEGMPKGAVPTQATLDNPIEVGRGGVSVGLVYSGAGGGSFTITALPVGWTSPLINPVTGIIEPGTPAATLPHSVKVPDKSVCKDSNGLHICVLDDPSKTADPLAAVGGAQGLLGRITSLGTDPAKWTTHVVD